MKKLIIAVLVVVMIAAIFVGCTNKNNNPQPTVTNPVTTSAKPTATVKATATMKPTTVPASPTVSPVTTMSASVAPTATVKK